MESITLYFKQGSSDKVYQTSIEPKDGAYVVNYAYGRRGTTLATGTKTSTAVNYDAARAIYGKLVNEKKAKGYTVGEDGTPYSHSNKISTGIHCQLLNPIGDDQIESLLNDLSFWMQQKYDGCRLLIDKRGDKIQGINRLGLSVALPKILETEIAQCPVDVILDGECVGDDFHCFDAQLIEDDEIGDAIKTAGNVTIPANHEIPKTGQVVECRYLYAHKESGSIFQPVYLGVRDDIPGEECTTAQLKYKAEPTEQAA
jgi:bifunctional non-homologous end joining protein LigD